jgi:hypothetical protein
MQWWWASTAGGLAHGVGRGRGVPLGGVFHVACCQGGALNRKAIFLDPHPPKILGTMRYRYFSFRFFWRLK